MSVARFVGALAMAGVLVGAAGCSGNSDATSIAGQPVAHTPSPATHSASSTPKARPTVAAKCASDWQNAGGKQVWFTDSSGAALGGVELGSGTAGVVLAHQSVADSCTWMPYGAELAAAGYHVLAFDFAGNGASPAAPAGDTPDKNVLGAAAFLRGEGAKNVVLIGAGMGGAAALVAASEVAPPELPVAGVISLSSPLQYSTMDPLGTAKHLTVPVVYIGGLNDPEQYQAVTGLFGATTESAKAKLIANSNRYGADMLKTDAPDAASVRSMVTNFLTAHAKG
jgi:pimeloyl-ACP methyl ester carboxylesterase